MREAAPRKYFDYSPQPAPTVESLATQVERLTAEVKSLQFWLAFICALSVLGMCFD